MSTPEERRLNREFERLLDASSIARPPVPPATMCDPDKPNATSPWLHDYEVVGEEFGSLAEGGSYEVLECRRCERKAYRPMAD